MSGTYQLSQFGTSTMELFPKNPLTKRWARQQIATGGTRKPIFSDIWTFESTFGMLQVDGEASFFESRFIAGGLYNAVLPHPITGNLTGFTGVAISAVDYTFTDVSRDFWAEGSRMALSVNIFATGTV